MMHHKDVVVCITDNKEKTYREYDFKTLGGYPFKKSSTVILPFDSEYKIFVKNNNKNHRILVKIDIDGTNVTDDGVVVGAGASGHIERFIDIAKKFKFVPANSDGVADPTSEDNGNITITIERECEPVYTKPLLVNNPILYYGTGLRSNTDPVSSCTLPTSYSCDSIPMKGGNRPASASNLSAGDVSRGINISCSVGGEAGNMFDAMKAQKDQSLRAQSLGEVGATVEGDYSNQKFTTTEWKGSEVDYDFQFVFTLRGRSETRGMSAKDAAEFEEYKRLQQKFAGK